MSKQEVSSVLGSSTRIVGRVSGQGDLRIEGRVEGDLAIGGTLELGGGSQVDGNVQAEALDVGGILQGDVAVHGLIAVRDGATVRGKLTGERISIASGATVALDLNMDVDLDR